MPTKRIFKWRGLAIGIECDPGDMRFAGTDHETTMKVGYGHFRGLIGADGEALDCYIGSHHDSEKIFQLHQLTVDGEPDEDKYFIGFNSIDEAKKAYLAHMPRQFYGGIVESSVDHIRAFRRSEVNEDFDCEVSATESVSGLPTIVKVKGPAKKLSLNNRNWIDQRIGETGIEGLIVGCAKSRDLIKKGEQLKVRYSHPKDDPEITGKESAGHLIDIGVDSATSEFYAVVELHHLTDDGLEVAKRIAAKDMPDFSFRARVNCDDQETLTGNCVPKPGHPVLIDFLRPFEFPGLPGSKVSEVIESHKPKHCPDKCDGSCDDCKSKAQPKTLATEALNNSISTNAGVPNISGGKTKGDKSYMSKILEDVINEIAGEPDEKMRKKMAGFAAKLLPIGNAPMTPDPPPEVMEEDAMPEKLEGETEEAYKARVATESVKKGKGSPKPAPKTNPTPAPKTTPQSRPKAESVSDEEAAESMGMSVEAFKIMKAESEGKARKLSLKTDLDNAYQGALKTTSDGMLFGYPIRDQKEKFPGTAVESYIAAANKHCADLKEATGFIKSKLEDLSTGKATATEAVETPNPALKGSMSFSTIKVGKDRSANKPDPTALEDVDKIEAAMLDWYKTNDPKKYAEYEANKGSRKLAHDQAREQALEQYGPRIRNYKKPDTATEDINPVDSSAVPNFARVMTAIMGIRYWIPSPMRQFFGVLPSEAMRLGPMLDNGDGPIGQFVEVLTEIRDQREFYDAAYFQLPTDPQREIGYRHGYHQYFAFQESTRFRTDSEVEFFMGLPPIETNIPARGLVNLRAELDLFDEQRGSTEALRAADAYASITIGVPETTNMAITSHRGYSASGGITTPGGTYVKNGIGWVIFRRGQSSSTDPLLKGPIMRPGIKPVWKRNTVVTVTFEEEYPVKINPIQGIVQRRGQYNPTTQMGEKINDRDGDITFIVLPDECCAVFLVGSGYNLSNGPTFTEYTFGDNYDIFDFANGGNAIEKQLLGNKFLEFIGAMRGGLHERQVPPEAIDFLVIPAIANENVANFATHLQGQNQLQYAGVSGNYQSGQGSQTAFFRNMGIHGSTEPLYRNRLRGLLGTSKLTVVQEIGAPEIGPKLPGAKLDTNGNVAWNSQWSQSLTRRHFINTVPRRDPSTGKPLEFGYAALYLNNVSSVVSRLPR